MENVTDRDRNPFGMSPPRKVEGEPAAVSGYGDANADVHVVGDYPGLHGGSDTGVPFTGSEAGRRLQGVLHAVGLLADPYSDEPRVSGLFVSYLHASVTPGGRRPTPAEYADLERFFDAELRAINAHVLVPVGERAVEHVLREYTARAHRYDPETAHAEVVAGRGVVVVPCREPLDWSEGDAEALEECLRDVLSKDYRQESDLGRFLPGGDPYFVR